MHREEIVLLLLKRLHTAWGKTRIQKLLFIAEARAVREPPAPFQYFLYKHGPFSLDVALTLDALRDKREVSETLRRTATARPLYIYTLNPEGFQRAVFAEARLTPEWRAALDHVAVEFKALDLPLLVEAAYAEARRRPELIQAGPPTKT